VIADPYSLPTFGELAERGQKVKTPLSKSTSLAETVKPDFPNREVYMLDPWTYSITWSALDAATLCHEANVANYLFKLYSIDDLACLLIGLTTHRWWVII
jgi:hypothetical protein